jgi:hypothetical protein
MSTLQSKLESAKETLTQNSKGLAQQETDLKNEIAAGRANQENVSANIARLARVQNLQKNINGLLNEQDSILAKVIEKNHRPTSNSRYV